MGQTPVSTSEMHDARGAIGLRIVDSLCAAGIASQCKQAMRDEVSDPGTSFRVSNRFVVTSRTDTNSWTSLTAP
jgi:hypothetical protein